MGFEKWWDTRAWEGSKELATAAWQACAREIYSMIEHELRQYKPDRYDDQEDYYYNSGAEEALDAILATIKGD